MSVSKSAQGCLEYLKLIGSLKHLKRTGWVRMQIPDPETVSGHMYRMAVMSFIFDEKDGVNKDRVMKLSLVHDMAESIVGDITPVCGVPTEVKHQREKSAMEHIKTLVEDSVGEELCALFEEYEDQKTPEAKLVKELDKFDMILQAFEYEKREKKPGFLQEFFDSAKGIFKHPKMLNLLTELTQQRNSTLES